MKNLKTSLLLGVAGACIATSVPAMAAEDEENTGGIKIITVTAQKREQNLQVVPIAVTAVDQETLQANRITTVNDLGSFAPGLTVRPSAGGIQVPSFTMRGQNSYGVVAGSDKQVSIYLDGVYISSPRGSIFDLPDVARLEVLRGPQGTLFGRNATAGAVSVVTRDPDGQVGARLEGTVSNKNGYRVRASIDTPQFGPFSAYVSFVRNFRHGDIRNLAAGTVWDRTGSPDKYVSQIKRSPKWLGSVDNSSYFAALKFETGDFKTVYKFDLNVDDGTPEGTAVTSIPPGYAGLGAGAPLLGPIFDALYAGNNLLINTTNQSPKAVSNAWVIPREQRVFGHSLTSTWEASDTITVKNIAAYRKSRVFAPSAIDGFSSLIFTPNTLVPYATFVAFSSIGRVPGINSIADAIAAIPNFAATFAPQVGNRVIGIASQASSISEQWSDEIQANYSSDQLNITLGALWFKSKDQAGGPEGQQNTFSFFSNPFINNTTGIVPQGNEGRYFNKATSIAAYLQVEYKFNDQLEVVLGSRVTHDKKTSLFRWDNLIQGVIVPRPNIVPPAYKKTKPSFEIGLNWTPNDDTLVYAKFSTSFVSGGSVAGINFNPETARSWEAGVKTDLLNRRLRANLAVFLVNYKGFQQPSSTTSPEAVDFLEAVYGEIATALASNLSTFVQQAHDVRATGFELEVTAAPTDGLTIGGSLSYTDTKFYNIDPVFLASQGGSYQSFVRPKWTASAFASYETQPVFADATIAFRLDGVYRSDVAWSSTPARRLGQGIPAQDLFSPAHWKLNGRMALKNVEVGGGNVEIAVWGRNLTNKRYSTSQLFLPFANQETYDEGRTYGLDVILTF